MTLKEYLKKVIEICEEYEPKSNCKLCPINPGCGVPECNSDINSLIKTVQEYEIKTYPFGRCLKCKKEFNSELVSEYKIAYCPWCGANIEED